MINAYQNAIEAIVNSGYTVLEIHPFNNQESFYFIVHKFISAMKTPTDDIQYNQLVGVNITNNIKNNSTIDRNSFMNQLQRYLEAENTSVVRMEFPNSMVWIKHAPAVK
jgi:hypothetical protein